MPTNGIPPLEPLAPIVDEMRVIGRTELPSPRTCTVQLWDDGTFDAEIYHQMGPEDRQSVRYERTTGEILWESIQGASWREEAVTDGESILEPVYEETDVRVLTRVEPPYE